MAEIEAPCVVIAAVISTADSDGKALAAARASTKQFNSTDHPQIARNHVTDPGDIARQLLNSSGRFRERHYQQIRFHRPHKIRRREPCRASNEARFDWNLSRAGRQDEFFKRI